MRKKFSHRRVSAFFTALEATGNLAVAAERARVSRSWIYLHRANDCVFKERIDAAMAAARSRLSAAPGVSPGDARASFVGGEELVVHGARSGRPRVVRARMDGWTPRAEQRFLAMMAATCSVVRSCEAAGMSISAAYNHRDLWPAFRRRWAEAKRIGRDRLNDYLLRSAQIIAANGYNRPEGEPWLDEQGRLLPIPPDMGFDEIIRLLEQMDWREARRG